PPPGSQPPGTQLPGVLEQTPTGDPGRRLTERILYTTDPRRDFVGFDPDSGIVELRRTLDNYDVGTPRWMPLRDYTHYLTLKNYDELCTRRIYDALPSTAQADASGLKPGRFKLELPIGLGGALGGIFGTTRPNLTLTGSETLTLGGTSNFSNQ